VLNALFTLYGMAAKHSLKIGSKREGFISPKSTWTRNRKSTYDNSNCGTRNRPERKQTGSSIFFLGQEKVY